METTITDFHCHVLPHMDDGSVSAEMSVAMLEESARQGIRRMVATPHFYPHRDTLEGFLRRREASAEALRKSKEGISGLPTVYLGAEVYFCRGMSQWEDLPRLRTGYNLLVEMPLAPWKKEHYEELRALCRRPGVRPVIAHIERYITPWNRAGILRKLRHDGVGIQANAEFFLNKKTCRMALDMLKKGQIDYLGSDCHDTSARKQNLAAAVALIREKLGQEALDRLIQMEESVFDDEKDK